MTTPPWIKALEIIGETVRVSTSSVDLLHPAERGVRRKVVRICGRCGHLLKECPGPEVCDGALARQALRAWRKARP